MEPEKKLPAKQLFLVCAVRFAVSSVQQSRGLSGIEKVHIAVKREWATTPCTIVLHSSIHRVIHSTILSLFRNL